ncbi:LysR family transcriptional regulator [Paraburkholderia bannensis]|uniref:LysR family transcriptional regulator n=1 Tax=Paraburkholderia bannensis TaxID=765414 RepID=UPI002AB765E1|nr:LysR family transcriptional regulator [Paraburkholderia bannensis]
MSHALNDAAPALSAAGISPAHPAALRVQDLDLNLLKTFRAVYQEKHVGRAALSLGVTQPSVSYGLGRLRLMFRDALFVRTGLGVEPTPRARRLAASVDKALAILQDVLDDGASFTPETTQRVFRLHMNDFAASACLPTLLGALDARAPGAVVETLHLDEQQLNIALEAGKIDFAIGHFNQASEHFQRTELLSERCVLILSEAANRRLGLADDFILDSRAPAGLRLVAVMSHPQSMTLLERHELTPRVRASLPDFLVLPSLLQGADYAAIVPRTIALSFAAQHPCAIHEIADAQSWSVNAYWHRRFDVDPGHRWLRALLVELFGIGEREPFDTWLASPCLESGVAGDASDLDD